MSRVYCGCRLRDVFGRVVTHRVWVEQSVALVPELPRQFFRELAPDYHGLAWGGESAGALNLAAYLLLDAAGEWERTAPYFHRFMVAFVARWPERWKVREESILRWLLEQERQAAADEVTQRLFVASGIREEESNGKDAGGAGGGLGPPGRGRGDAEDSAGDCGPL